MADKPQNAPVLKTGTNITVGCKLPNGLNVGALHGPDKPIVILNGANHRHAIAGCGLTHGVDKDAFEAWLHEHAEFEPVKRGMIFAFESPREALGFAKELKDEASGFEGLSPEEPVKGVEPTDEQKKENAKAEEQRADHEDQFGG